MAETIEYYISDPVLFVDEKAKKRGALSAYYWEYNITNNVELPDHKYRALAIGGRGGSAGRGTYFFITNEVIDAAEKNNWGISFENKYSFYKGTGISNPFIPNSKFNYETVGKEPQELKDEIWKYQKSEILLEFEGKTLTQKPPYIEAKSYKNQRYPKLGTPLSLYNQDPIEYTFNSIIIDKTTQEPLSGVKIKDLDGIKTTSNNDGSFEIKGTFSPGKVQKLIFNQKKYASLILVITTLNGSIRSDINIVDLVPDSADVEGSIARAQGSTKEEREKMTKEEKKDFIKSIAQNVINELKERALPFAIKKLLCEPYGICDPIGLIDQAKELKNKAKDLNEKRKENKAQKQSENEIADNQNGDSLPATNY